MAFRPVPPNDPEVERAIFAMVATGKPREQVLRAMRDDGLFMGQSVLLSMKVWGLSLREAQLLVHHSETWSDCRESQEKLQDAFFEAFEQLAREPDYSLEKSESPELSKAS